MDTQSIYKGKEKRNGFVPKYLSKENICLFNNQIKDYYTIYSFFNTIRLS